MLFRSVFSVIGNHDYSDYIEATPDIKAENEKETRELERKMGWRLLVNEHEVVRRGTDSIVIAGLDNDGDGKKFPQRGDVRKALEGVSDSAFVVMAEHDPTCWRRKILLESRAQLTQGHRLVDTHSERSDSQSTARQASPTHPSRETVLVLRNVERGDKEMVL